MSTIFFSWQSDRPADGGENLIQDALLLAIKSISGDTTLEKAVRELSVDRDTMGVPGSPPIVATIFDKIDSAALFVPDLTFVGTRVDGRPTPNPNVLVEYGWALKSLGHFRIVPVMNSAYGKPGDTSMPFDMRHLRHPITYTFSESTDPGMRNAVVTDLAQKFADQIRGVLKHPAFTEAQVSVIERKRYTPKSPQSGFGRFVTEDSPIGESYDSFGQHSRKPIKLKRGSVIWFRVMPIYEQGRKILFSDLMRAAKQDGLSLPLMGFIRWSAMGYYRFADGLGIHEITENSFEESTNVVQAFNSGEVWAADSEALDVAQDKQRKYFPLKEILATFKISLEKYSSYLQQLGIEPPYRWMAGMEDMRDRELFSGNRPWWAGRSGAPCMAPTLQFEGTYSPGESLDDALRVVLEESCDACGVDPNEWTPP